MAGLQRYKAFVQRSKAKQQMHHQPPSPPARSTYRTTTDSHIPRGFLSTQYPCPQLLGQVEEVRRLIIKMKVVGLTATEVHVLDLLLHQFNLRVSGAGNAPQRPLSPINKRCLIDQKKRTKKVYAGRTCDHCGTDYTSQWRSGPCGPSTLCNACGIRYSRQQDKLRTAITSDKGGATRARSAAPPASSPPPKRGSVQFLLN